MDLFLIGGVPRDRLINIEISNDYDFMTDSKSFFTFAKILYEKEKKKQDGISGMQFKIGYNSFIMDFQLMNNWI